MLTLRRWIKSTTDFDFTVEGCRAKANEDIEEYVEADYKDEPTPSSDFSLEKRINLRLLLFQVTLLIHESEVNVATIFVIV